MSLLDGPAAQGYRAPMLHIPPPIPIAPSIAELASRYGVWLCDIWGVLHNGVSPFPSAADACRTFRAQGGKVALITNAPRPTEFVAAQLAAMGIDGVYDAIATSGDVTMRLLRERAGQAVFHLGPERDKPILEGLDLRRVGPDEADFILNSGPFHDETETPEDYRALFTALAARTVPMVCANPDHKVERGDTVIYCAGALAALYEQMGGAVVYAGKPHAPIYELALHKLGVDAGASRILAIGDGVYTDILGAAIFGVDALFIASGVHMGRAGLDAESLAALFDKTSFRPVAAQARLAW
ncbi:MAG: TIGR01459 family HAD-type hydrolase [Hyphomicrobiales bacterium]|nr:TIGR01459 family HAD-type hydrolase [Hyphomicrobiales bacterium]